MRARISGICCSVLAASACTLAVADVPPTMADVLAVSTAGDWQTPSSENTLYLELESGRVVLELAPQFAPLPVRLIQSTDSDSQLAAGSAAPAGSRRSDGPGAH